MFSSGDHGDGDDDDDGDGDGDDDDDDALLVAMTIDWWPGARWVAED